MNITFVLVEPAIPENVGSAARAIKTMGFSDLRLVNPCDHLCDKALMLAHGSHDILQNAKIYTALNDALLDVDFSVATSAKSRWVKQDIIPSNELKTFLTAKKDSINSVAIVFGCEESGLSNHDIAICDRVASIPLVNPFPSLNLAQAVMVFAYALTGNITEDDLVTERSSTSNAYKPLQKKVVDILNTISITPSSLVHGRVLERLSEITSEDINLLHSVCTKILEKLKNED